jgi:uncharacterized protein
MNERASTPGKRLDNETSPYLLQHADNPVDWFPWGAQALEVARGEDRPILLSVGYSACHWCHVMAHESFEDEATAELMNDLFVNIKVDREERPDIDRIYQLAHQLLTKRSGGWPLTVFLNPHDQRPFFAGTYFPNQARAGMPPFAEVMQRVADYYRENSDDVHDQGERLVQAMARIEPAGVGAATLMNDAPMAAARAQLGEMFDGREGGFGEAPKFPHPTNLERLLRHHARTGRTGKSDGEALAMVLFTLAKMGNGGLYDQLGGGFYRYSTDERWMIPHFEKMLYDNAPLMELCVQAWQLSAHDDFRRWATETAEWVKREMVHVDGAFFSTLDADSDGEEGKFYVWEPDEARALLEEDEYEAISVRFGLDQAPNFEETSWHLHVAAKLDELGMPLDDAERAVRGAREKLLSARTSSRVLPGRDEKILASWNGMMIRAMARTGAVLARPDFINSAYAALDFVRRELWVDGRLLATCKDGKSHLMAYLDDHAFLIEAVLACLSARWRDDTLPWAIELAELLLQRFADPDTGGFYFTADDHETLIHRARPLMDDAMPSGNAVAVQALARLGHLIGEPRYLQAAELGLRSAWIGMERIPHAHSATINALEEWLDPVETVVIRAQGDDLIRWQSRAQATFAPRRQVFGIPLQAHTLPGLLSERIARSDGPLAYICRGHQCDAPISDFSAFETLLKPNERRLPPPASAVD